MTNPLKDKDGKTGLLRCSVVVVLLCVMTVWVRTSWVNNEMTPLSLEDVILILGVLGAKTVQTVKD
ncbi:hypothetical protein MLD52_09160 [Puniceicoccaceae bacterium K14]|nr:hypothetical protein [Puniceicoccaceae bacterium K14]